MRALFMNLCNHKKILIVDGAVGFTGGMNISADHCPSLTADDPILMCISGGGPGSRADGGRFSGGLNFATDENAAVGARRRLKSKAQ